MKKVIIAGGGSGGHIYPAIAIGLALMKIAPDCQVRFVGTAEGLEKKIMARENLDLDLIWSGKLNYSGQVLKKIKTLIKIPIGFLQSIGLILKHQPDFILGVGGYASAPFLMMAALLRRRSALWEPNAHPGLANRILSNWVPRAYLVFAEAQKYLKSKKVKVMGMPLRAEIDLAQKKAVEKKANAERFTILCFGGSQGSLFLNQAISDFVINHPELHNQIEVIHQTGSVGYNDMKKKYGHLTCVQIHEFIYDMPTYYKKADIQFCRGGASTIAEAAAFGVVPLIVPLQAADNHQLRNAEAVVQADAGFLFRQDQFDSEIFSQTILKLKNDLGYRTQLSENLKKLAPSEAAIEIAKDILSEITH